ncbi:MULTISPECIES: twin-arginine translocase TatA/TatE family subunit [Cryobacterium]|uniref:Sec-independent protein translocase protein TatA n=1 Tax=Cryobacterium breve TaxID=1259258 RepID=A0ABY2IXU0_9MICO|nr:MULTISPECIES: twin-arginine translocase TatA/TatE family subunit [Cryobacterium]TFC96899.1 twin-arginine translocase TatA/TatE family subunit [Cryobacterium sp. TmT3-12]TFC97305.1 twin-arginine translocase TatA/TatE family subunit [Cryobacterium breve]
MLNNLTGWHFLIILVIVLLLFGAPKLPGLARSLGQSMKIFKNEIKSDKDDADTTGTAGDSSKAAGTADPSTKS